VKLYLAVLAGNRADSNDTLNDLNERISLIRAEVERARTGFRRPGR